MTHKIYTVITFAPVQGFIEKSRKLRDLYGSSYLLSYLSWVICNAAEKHDCQIISPASPNMTQGMPNLIIIQGNFREKDAKSAFDTAWECVTETCRDWIESHVSGEYYWKRNWDLWRTHAWEFFWVQGESGESISDVRQRSNNKKYWRDWTGINWQGESSTLSGADAIAYPRLGKISDPRQYNYQQEKTEINHFYEQLQNQLGESFIDPSEELSIPELIKRMITHEVIAEKLIQRLEPSLRKNGVNAEKLNKQIRKLSKELSPKSFKDLSRQNDNNKTDNRTSEKKYWTGWFQGDGDKAGDYLKKFAGEPEEAQKIEEFSLQMREWGKFFQKNPPENCRVIYAGGDDFLGVFHDAKEGRELQSSYCVNQLSKFKTEIWDKPKKKPISVSVGFVWAGPGVPQRDVLQHCREAEKSAKSNGRDRIAFRVLFNNGNYLEWVCPWWLLETGLLSSYCDREHNQEKPNWTHIYNDVAVLESRHVFDDDGLDIALGLLEIYFPTQTDKLKPENWWNEYDADKQLIKTGILGDRLPYTTDNTETGKLNQTKVNKALTNWIINLAKVGFHLCQESKQ
ncbi:type III-B CRISPR-associated protein Cas10/Cmr2 [Brasilonema sp. UFV-L1]|uniref:Cas10/Cmr2 second palm domain-containing protein n=1 Tax=Brasilonema sp. UFV-L1 TaxID=2234130 RepID=UPI00145E54BF|nr:type III-B CRISPR-associated protein Cas10/Cmr2 [Brasilonema sp. UFV-L1]NMG07206.1 CRISPR-associated protein [Brasilonema sp. UFV-L1]